jgi:poly(A) polymerase
MHRGRTTRRPKQAGIFHRSMSDTRKLALEIAERLQAAGHQALLAGGCVRDTLLGAEPDDYDVATSARPEEVQELFGRQRTLAIGAAFGVIAVLGADRKSQVEVATFRADGGYSDGRRPDTVTFTDARNDALRRDFTINGLFQDPMTGTVHDFVEGRRDLEERIIRAIGDPHQRISEDKLRMLRAVRFTARFGFELDAATRAAVMRHAPEIRMVSGERIGAEMKKMLTHPSRALAASLLEECRLLAEIVDGGDLLTANLANWRTRLKWLEGLGDVASFPVVATVLLGPVIKEYGVQPLMDRWKLSAAEAASIRWLEENWLTLLRAHSLPWSAVQPLLVHPDGPGGLQIATAAGGPDQAGVRLCQQRLAWSAERLDPPPLINGESLKKIGLVPGPQYGRILEAVRCAQLDGKVQLANEAEELARSLSAGG